MIEKFFVILVQFVLPQFVLLVAALDLFAVSYTHLTLPTSDLV